MAERYIDLPPELRAKDFVDMLIDIRIIGPDKPEYERLVEHTTQLFSGRRP